MDIYAEAEGRNNDLLFCEGYPCNIHVDGGLFPAEARDFRVGVWSDPAWVHVNQQFKLFVTVFYEEPAPEGWSFVNGDA